MPANSALPLIVPEWPAPTNVRAVQTTRHGGVSEGVYTSLNLGSHVGDVPQSVAANRARVQTVTPTAPVWLTQVHGIAVVDAASAQTYSTADAAVARDVDRVCAVMTADCLPVLLCDRAGSVVAAAHAGWRGLVDGVIESTVQAMAVSPDTLMAWLGPAIGPEVFEVGDEVRRAFVAHDAAAAKAFRPGQLPGKWMADIYKLARQRLAQSGVTAVYGGGRCTVSEADAFFSYRRDGQTGRMASMIWLEA